MTWMEGVDTMRSDLDAMRADLSAMRSELALMRADLRDQISRSHADLMKWSFVFWVGAVTAIAALAGVLKG
jgi:hypothetical protein